MNCFWLIFKPNDKKTPINEFFDFITVFGYTSLTMSQTYQPKKRKRAKAHGFLSQSSTKNGKKVIQKRRQKGRAKLSA